MYETTKTRPNALLVAVTDDSYDEVSLLELEELVETAGADVVFKVTQNRNSPDRATCVGIGKLHEIKAVAEQLEVGLVVFDNSLSPTQLRNIEEILSVKTMDRSGIILEIFALRAKSAEGKVQVELAQLNYLLPRLRGEGINLSRLAGGIGTRGPGETKLETDRRHILRRIQFLKERLLEIQSNRNVQQQKRRKNNVPVVSIAGYTNAGKSTLMNRLSDAGVYVENMLFATLDSTTRRIKLPNGRDVLLSDTVGFIKNLPHELIYAFKSTLDEIRQADLVLLVCDITSLDFAGQLETVKRTIAEIGYAGKLLEVYNKTDLEGEELVPFPGADCVYISAKNGFGIDLLLEKIQDAVAGDKEYMLELDYSKIDVYYRLKNQEKVVEEDFSPERVRFRARLSDEDYLRYRQYIADESK